ncbi:MAG: outer membrane beta-barrel protein, partial [Prevotella sp.]|nr:outer membrane beta-barrel protein [Prevotella sp.]
MIIKYAPVILLFFVSTGIFAQQASSIEGMVMDSLTAEPVEMAAIALRYQKDKSFAQGAASAANGYFVLKNVKPAAYELLITFLGYDTVRINISEKRFAQGKINLGKINLHTADIQLSSVIITAEIPEVIVKEDTIEYNAAAFKLPESAVVEDLFKRLPGVEVDTEGKITTPAGKEVKRVFVDGKEFFGSDPKMATRNLTADIVDKVQVVEKKSDLAILTGVEDDDPETIINITIKKGMKKGWMGNVNGGAGEIIDNQLNESARYSTALNVNRFTEQDQFSFVANANNINRRASSDRGNTVRSGRSGGAGGNGITSSNTFGVNTNNIINDKLKFGGSISYNYSDNYVNNSSIRQTFFENDSSTFRTSASNDRDYSNNISFNGRFEYTPDSATTIIFTPSASYNFSTSRSASEQLTLDNRSDSINSSHSANTLKSDGLSLRMQFDISRKLSATGRRASFSGWFSIDNSSGDGTNNSENIFYRNHLRDKILDQQSHTTGDRLSYNLRATYVEPVGSGNFLNFSYQMQVNSTKNRKTTLDYDEDSGKYTTLNPDYSKSSDTYSTTQNIRANFNSNKTNYTYNVGLSVSPVFNKSKNFIEDWYGAGQDSIVNLQSGRHTANYAPFLDFTYLFGNNRMIRRNLKIKYNGQSRQPSITQLDPSEDNTNPLNIRSGNPDLLPSFNNNISLEYNFNNRETQRSLTTTVAYTFVQNE